MKFGHGSAVFFVTSLLIVGSLYGQEFHPAQSSAEVYPSQHSDRSVGVLTLTLQDTISRARNNSVQFQAAVTKAKLAAEAP